MEYRKKIPESPIQYNLVAAFSFWRSFPISGLGTDAKPSVSLCLRERTFSPPHRPLPKLANWRIRSMIPDMDHSTYRLLHVLGATALALGLGGIIVNSAQRKGFVILQGVALLLMLVSGFGLLGKLHLGFPHFAIAKLALWAITGALPVMFKKLALPPVVATVVSLAVIGLLAWLGIFKPALW